MKEIKNIIIIGAGNVAKHLGTALKDIGKNIGQVYSRSEASANLLAVQLNAQPIVDLKNLDPDADLYIISIPDSAVKSVVSNISLQNKMIVHTSGSLPIEILQKASSNFGVFYPLQSISKNVQLNFREIPLCIEASNDETEQALINLAKQLSDHVQAINSEQRKVLHIAAVFANNFSNFMFNVSKDILAKHDLSFDLLKPILKTTFEKAATHDPFSVQTGPAVREDMNILKEHLQFLSNEPDYKEIYELITKLIIKTKNNKTT